MRHHLLFLIAFVAASTAWAAPLPQTIAVSPVTFQTRFKTSKNQALLQTLIDANKAIRKIAFFQAHRHALLMKHLFKKAFSNDSLAQTRARFSLAQFNELVQYALNFEYNCGPFDAYQNEKFELALSTPSEVEAWLREVYSNLAPTTAHEIARLMADPVYEKHEYPVGEDLSETGGNLYEHGIGSAEVDAAIAGGLKLAANARVVRADTGLRLQKLTTQESSLPAEIHEALEAAVAALTRALPLLLSHEQKNQLEAMLRYLSTGDAADDALMTQAFIRDSVETPIRFYLNFPYSYYDFKGVLSKLDSTVLFVDPELTRVTLALGRNSQYFEDRLPFGDFRRKFPANYAPGILMVQGLYRGSLTDDPGFHFENPANTLESLNLIPNETLEKALNPDALENLRARLSSFIPEAEVESTLKNHSNAITHLVLLHEALGHNSGTVDPSKYKDQDPYTAMGPEGVSLEEMRANLVSITRYQDPKLVEIGLAKTQLELSDELKAWLYQNISTVSSEAAKSLVVQWPHFRAGFFLINYWLSENVLELKNGIFKIVDLDKLVGVSEKLLAEAQRVRATRDEKRLAEMYSEFAPVDATKIPWVNELHEKALLLKPPATLVYQPFIFSNDGELELVGDTAKPETLIPGY